MEKQPLKSSRRDLEDIVFTEADRRWVHHPHNDALVITKKIENNNVHRMLVDNGSAVDILYLNTYKRMSVNKSDLQPCASSLYGFTSDYLMP